MSSTPEAIPFSPAQVWEQTLAQLLLRVTRQNYETWLRNTVGLRFEDTTLIVAAANELACDWLTTRMRSVIARSLTAVAGTGLQVRFEPAQTPVGDTQTPLQSSMLPEAARPLNPRFTFETFLEADSNRLALTAARELSSSAECSYSPLFITGSAGSGKTHLLHAIARAAVLLDTSYLLVNAEQFVSEFTTAVRGKNGAAFRARYRAIDLLLIDDIHLLLGKKATLNEFYITLASLHDQGKRIAVAGDPSATAGEAARFKGLLRWGLVATIEQTSMEERIRFIARKASYQGAKLPDEVQQYLALRVRSSVRDLEGAVNRVTALARISGQPITIDFVARALQQPTATPSLESETTAPSELLDAVCKHLGLCLAEVAGQKRDRTSTYARHLAMYLLRQKAGLSYAAIAHLLGKKDHSTVVHACAQVHKELSVSPQLRADIDAVLASIHRANPAA